MNKKEIIEKILSEECLNEIINSERWGIFHGSHIIEYFIDNDLELEYACSKSRKKILKRYIVNKLPIIFSNIENEQKKFLYRSVYLNEKPKIKDKFGIFWSSDKNTAPCVQHNGGEEFLLKIDFDNDIINWKNTILSRLDYLYGDNEKEYQILDEKVNLISYKKN